MADDNIKDAVKEALAELLPSTLKEHGITPPPKPEPTTYNEFMERFTEDFTELMSKQKETPPPADEGDGKGKRRADEPPAAGHGIFRTIGGGKEASG